MLENKKNIEMNSGNKNINTKRVFGIGLAVGALVGGCSVFASSKILEKRSNIFVEDFDFDEDYNDEDDDFVDVVALREQIHESFRTYAIHLVTNSRKISVNEVLEYIESNLEPLIKPICADEVFQNKFNSEIRAYDEIKRRLEAFNKNIILDDDLNPTTIPRLLNVDLPDDPADVKRLKIRDAGAKLILGMFTYSRCCYKSDNYVRESVQETKNFIANIAVNQYKLWI